MVQTLVMAVRAGKLEVFIEGECPHDSTCPSPPRVVAISGIVFSALYIASLVLIRLAVPADPTDPGALACRPSLSELGSPSR